MPKTLLLTHFFPPTVGGIEEYYRHVAEHVAPSELVVLTQATAAAPASEGRVLRVDFFPGRLRPRWLPWLWRFPRVLRQHRIEQLWLGHLSPLTPVAWWSARRRGLRVLLSVHGADLLVPGRSAFSRWIVRFILRHVDTVIANSEFLATELRTRGVADERIVIVPPGITLPTMPTADERTALRQRLGVQESWLLLTVGRLVKRKGIDRLIDAVAQLQTKLPELRLAIIGDGPERSALEALVASRGISDRVHFLGALAPTDPQKQDWFFASNAFALVSRPAHGGTDIESYGIVYHEAHAAGLPVIASRLGGATEIVQSDVNGFLIDEGDDTELQKRLLELANNPETARRLGSAGRDAAEHNTWQSRWPLVDAVLNPDSAVQQPLISIIIPCWNVAELLPSTLASIAAQTHRHVEIIAVNDGSTDATTDVLANASNVRVITQQNRGAAVARNAGAASARGEFLLFCDADVILEPHALATFVRLLELHPDRDIAYSAFHLGWRSFHRLEFDPERLRRHNYINTVSLLRASAFPGFDETLHRYQDWDLWLTMSERGAKGIGTNQYLFHTASRPGITRKKGMLPHADLLERFMPRKASVQSSHDMAALEQLRQKHRLA